MVPKKGKSKRTSGSRRYKIEKNARDHHRKVRKDAKKNPTTKKVKKDPGIPNLYPFKEKLLGQIEENKIKAEQEKEKLKQMRASLPTSATHTPDQLSLAALVHEAAARSATFAPASTYQINTDGSYSMSDPAVTGGRDNSRKAYYKEFKKVISSADVILEVLDARDPLGSRAKEIEELIMNSGANKRIVLVLNKIDLAPRDNVEAWLKHLRNEFPTVAFKSSTQSQKANLGHTSASSQHATDSQLAASECLGAENLVKLLKNYTRNASIKTAITVGVIGFPNVGKSSVINSLKRSRVCTVGSTPGMTKSAQTIQLDKTIRLLDCPGIVFGQASRDGQDAAEVALRNCVKVELLEDPVTPVELIVSRCKPTQLMSLYKIPQYFNTQDFLVHLARQRGKLKKGGIPDVFSTARVVLNDWNTGRIPFYTVPPTRSDHLDSSIVHAWSKEFELPTAASTDETDDQPMEMEDDILKASRSVKAGLLALDPQAHGVHVDMEAKYGSAESVPVNDGFGAFDESEFLDAETDMVDMDPDAATGMDLDDQDEVPEAVPANLPPPPSTIMIHEAKLAKTASGKAAKAAAHLKKQKPALEGLEAEINPQLNQSLVSIRKKQAKAKKKETKRLTTALQSLSVDQDSSRNVKPAPYDFGEFFNAPNE